MTYKYFVSFFFKDSNSGRFGVENAVITRTSKITMAEDIARIKKDIETEEGIDGVTIINYILMEEYEDWGD